MGGGRGSGGSARGGGGAADAGETARGGGGGGAAERGPARLSTRQRGVLLAGAAATALTFFDQTATTAALNDIERDLGATAAELQWIMGAYLLAIAALVPAAGRLADVYGRRRLFLVGVALFGAASVACAAAPSISALIALRALQGVGAALVIPLALANVAAVVPEQRRGWAIGVLATGGSTFLSLGPLLGGMLVSIGGWRWVFAVGVPVAALSLWAGSRWMEESRAAPAPARSSSARRRAGSRAPQRPPLDGAGLALLAAGLGAVVVGLLQLTTWGFWTAPTLVALGGGALLLVAFVPVERRAAQPVIALKLLRIPSVGGYLGALLAGQFAVTALTVELMLYLQGTLGYDALVAGLLFLPTVVATPFLSPFAGRLADRGRGRAAVSAGLLAAAVALLWIALTAGAERIWVLLPAFALFGLSRPFVFTPSSTGPVVTLPPGERGVASALVTEAYQLGAVLGIAVAGAIVASADGAGDFVGGFQLAVGVAGGLCLAAAVAARMLLPGSAPTGATAARAQPAAEAPRPAA